MCSFGALRHKYLGLSSEYGLMQSKLKEIVTSLQAQMRDDSSTDYMAEIRLCVDYSGGWSFRTGAVDCSEVDSKYHAASFVGFHTISDELLGLLIDQILEQVSD